MRLQLSALAGLLALFTPGVATPTEAGARVDTYTDGSITVVSPTTRVLHPMEGGELEVRYGLDVLSGATQRMTVDGISSATHFEEARHEAQVGGRWRPTTGDSLGLTYALSFEPDFLTHRFSLAGELELMERMATLKASYGLDLNEAGRSDDPEYAQTGHGHELDLAWVHILGRRTQLTAQLFGRADFCEEALGCHASPYRFVAVGPELRWALSERHPDTRYRYAGALRVSQALFSRYALHAGYRYYGDSWSVRAHTTDLALAAGLWAERLVLRAEGRFTWQTSAAFYRDDYTNSKEPVPAYRTGDRELASLWNVGAGGRLEASLSGLGPFRQARLNLRVLRLWYRYRDFSEFPSRDAWLLGGGLSAAF